MDEGCRGVYLPSHVMTKLTHRMFPPKAYLCSLKGVELICPSAPSCVSSWLIHFLHCLSNKFFEANISHSAFLSNCHHPHDESQELCRHCCPCCPSCPCWPNFSLIHRKVVKRKVTSSPPPRGNSKSYRVCFEILLSRIEDRMKFLLRHVFYQNFFFPHTWGKFVTVSLTLNTNTLRNEIKG